MKKEIYYIYRNDDGTTGRIAKFSNCLFYSFDDGVWVENANLIRIFFEITNFEEISKEEAEKIIKEEYMINTIEEFKEVVARLRNSYKDVILTTDIIVGFPGETNEEFDKALEEYNNRHRRFGGN